MNTHFRSAANWPVRLGPCGLGSRSAGLPPARVSPRHHLFARHAPSRNPRNPAISRLILLSDSGLPRCILAPVLRTPPQPRIPHPACGPSGSDSKTPNLSLRTCSCPEKLHPFSRPPFPCFCLRRRASRDPVAPFSTKKARHCTYCTKFHLPLSCKKVGPRPFCPQHPAPWDPSRCLARAQYPAHGISLPNPRFTPVFPMFLHFFHFRFAAPHPARRLEVFYGSWHGLTVWGRKRRWRWRGGPCKSATWRR